jgi:hypothetical protein
MRTVQSSKDIWKQRTFGPRYVCKGKEEKFAMRKHCALSRDIKGPAKA